MGGMFASVPERRCAFAVLACLVLIASRVTAHETGPEPRADASKATVGVVSFANSGAREAQADFLYGLAQLHNFQYPDAAEAFRRAQRRDPGFALAYWGEAMTYNHPVWFQQDAAAARAVLARLGPDRATRLARARTERERAYLDAVETLYGEGSKFERDRRYAAAMRRLHERWPDDVDAAAFYALSLLGTAHYGRDVATYMRAYAIVQPLFERYPRHPGVAHYLIHSVDDAAHAPLGLAAARAYGRIAPESAHANHMTSHIYLALGLWDDVARANEDAIAVATRRARAAGHEPAGCGHAETWLAYAYVQQGRAAKARAMIRSCLQQVQSRPVAARDADQFESDGSSLGSFYEMRLRYLVDLAGDDAEVLGWTPIPAAVPFAAFLRDYTEALLGVRTDGATHPNDAISRALESGARLRAAMDRLAVPERDPARRVLAIETSQLDALRVLAKGDTAGAIAALRAAAVDEDALPAAFGPPQVEVPTRELLGSLLAQAHRHAEARDEYQRALELNPGRVGARRGLELATRVLGDTEEADAIAAQLRRTLARADARAASR